MYEEAETAGGGVSGKRAIRAMASWPWLGSRLWSRDGCIAEREGLYTMWVVLGGTIRSSWMPRALIQSLLIVEAVEGWALIASGNC
jgi:hypothetical protein